MKACPYCKTALNRKTIKTTRLGNRRWFENSTQPFLQKVCSSCGDEVVKKFNDRWYYVVGRLSLFAYPLIVMLGQTLSYEVKILLLLFAIFGFVITYKQSNDFKYITIEEQKNDRVKTLIKYANGHFENPIESGEYCKKYSLTKSELNKMISLGLIEAYAIDGCDFLNDEEPKKET